MDAISILLFIALLIAVYFLPAIVAYKRGHKNRHAIMATNIFLGWIFLGWIVAMIWSFTGNVENKNA